jgi:hypothetical protein
MMMVENVVTRRRENSQICFDSRGLAGWYKIKNKFKTDFKISKLSMEWSIDIDIENWEK